MTDTVREVGVIVAHLNRALLDGSRDLRTVPGLLKRVIADKMWCEWADPVSGRKFGPFGTFSEFAEAPAAGGGLGSSVRQLRQLCQDDTEARDAIDRACARPEGRPGHTSDNIRGKPPQGTSAEQALRRLRKDRPDLHAEVLAGRLKPHAAMVQAGFRHPTITIRADDPESAARALFQRMSPDDTASLIAALLALREEDQ